MLRPCGWHLAIDTYLTLRDSLIDLADDSVFAVKEKLVIDFKPVSQGFRAAEHDLQDKVVYELQQDFHLVRAVRKDDAEITSPHPACQ